jgi:molybdate transport system permease protein
MASSQPVAEAQDAPTKHPAVLRRVGATIRRRLGRGVPLWLAALPLLLFLALPLAVLVARSVGADALAQARDPGVQQAVGLSLWTTLLTTALTIAGGTPLAFMLARRRFTGRTIMDALVDLPVVLPPAVAGIALLVTFGRRGFLGSALAHLGISLPFTSAAVVLAQIFVAAPLYIRAAKNAFDADQQAIEEAAALDGAAPWRVFVHMTLPLALPALISGAVMTWARALGEFGATIIFAGNSPGTTQTIPLAIYLGFDFNLQTALALSGVLLAVAFGVLGLVKGLLHRQIAPRSIE